MVETTLEGHGGRIKEYVIALEVFEKSETYDPQADSTDPHRGEQASRQARPLLRDREAGTIRWSSRIPKGSYMPAFEDRRERNGGDFFPRTRPIRVRAMAAVLAVAIAVAAAGVLWLSRASSSPPPRLVPLTSYPGIEEQPSLSPDGSQVAFSWKGDIYVKAVGSEAVQQITKDPAVDSWPAWFQTPARSHSYVAAKSLWCPRWAEGATSGGVGGSSGVDAGRLGHPRSAKDFRPWHEHL